MTSRHAFDSAYARVLAALRVSLDPRHAEECWRAAQGFAADTYDAAASRLNLTARFLPSPAEWVDACRAVVDELVADRQQAYADAAASYQEQASRRYCCAICQDTGWELGPGGRPLRCMASAMCDPCARSRWFSEHTYTRPCVCRATNPVYQSRRTSELRRRSVRRDADREHTRRPA